MMTDEELIARLRGAPADTRGNKNLCLDAADRIEALLRERVIIPLQWTNDPRDGDRIWRATCPLTGDFYLVAKKEQQAEAEARREAKIRGKP